jgi:hypothetical protein
MSLEDLARAHAIVCVVRAAANGAELPAEDRFATVEEAAQMLGRARSCSVSCAHLSRTEMASAERADVKGRLAERSERERQTLGPGGLAPLEVRVLSPAPRFPGRQGAPAGRSPAPRPASRQETEGTP